MTISPERKFYWLEQGALHYVIIGVIALAVIYLDLGQRGLDLWAVFPAAIGLAGLATRWAAAPILLILSVALSLSMEIQFSLGSALLIPDLILGAAVLAYVMAQCRLTLIDRAFDRPRPPRKKMRLRRAKTTSTPPTSPMTLTDRPLPSQRLVSPREVGRVLLVVPVWAMLATCCWLLLPTRWQNPGIQPNFWRMILLMWVLAGPLLITAVAIGYLQMLQQTPAEAALALQDVLWRETRWEQRRINRWFAWAHVRQAKGKRRLPLRWIFLVLTVLCLAVVFLLRSIGAR